MLAKSLKGLRVEPFLLGSVRVLIENWNLQAPFHQRPGSKSRSLPSCNRCCRNKFGHFYKVRLMTCPLGDISEVLDSSATLDSWLWCSRDVVRNGITKDDYELFVKLRREELDLEEERCWYAENGFVEADFLEELEQEKQNEYGYTDFPTSKNYSRKTQY